MATWLLLIWAMLHIVGGAVLSILPLPILPFQPEQSLRHYAFHILYGLIQLPLLLATIAALRHKPGQVTTGNPGPRPH